MVVLVKVALALVHGWLALLHSGGKFCPSFYVLLLTVSAWSDVIMAPLICFWGSYGGYGTTGRLEPLDQVATRLDV